MKDKKTKGSKTMTTYEYLQDKQPMRKSKHDLINVLAEQLNRPRHEIQEEFEQLLQDGKVLAYQDGMYYRVSIAKPKKPIQAKVESIEAPPIAYKIYKHFKDSFVGLGNARKMADIAAWYGISERELRDIIYRINFRGYNLKNGNTFTRKILGDVNGYYMVANEEEKKHFRSIRVKKLLSAVKELKITDEDFGHDNQFKLSLSEFEKELVKSVSDDL